MLRDLAHIDRSLVQLGCEASGRGFGDPAPTPSFAEGLEWAKGL